MADDIKDLLAKVRDLDPDAIRGRLIAMEGEEKALRTLLRVTLQARRSSNKRGAGK